MKVSQPTKNKIEIIIKTYIELFPYEYRAFNDMMDIKVADLINKFGEVQGSEIVERKIAEYPENLYMILMRQLDTNEHKEVFSKEGQRWLVRNFPAFKAVQSV